MSAEALILEWIAFFATIALVLSFGFTHLYEIMSGKEIVRAYHRIYILYLQSALYWVAYGMDELDYFPLTAAYGAAAFILFVYVGISYYYLPERRTEIIIELVVVIVLYLIIVLASIYENSITFLSGIAALANILIFAPNIWEMFKMYANKVSSYSNWIFVVALLITSLAWLAFSAEESIWALFVPNIFGAAIAISLIVMKSIYPSEKNVDEEQHLVEKPDKQASVPAAAKTDKSENWYDF